MNISPQKYINQAVNHFKHIADYLKIPTTEAENQRLIEFTRELKKSVRHAEDEASELLNIIYQNIETYEKSAYAIKAAKPQEVLAFLMEQHLLSQSDLPEIGTQPHVSKVLKGTRHLTLKQIGKLAKRFNVSPLVFIQGFNH